MVSEIKILGLGIKGTYWKGLAPLLEATLSNQWMAPEIRYFAKPWRDFSTKALQALFDFKPDFVFTSLDAFGSIEAFEEFFQNYQAAKHLSFPSIFLVEKKIPQELKKMWQSCSPLCLSIAGFGKVEVTSSEALLEQVSEHHVLPISPAPQLIFPMESLCHFEKDHQRCFIPLQAVDKIQWQEQEYSPEQFTNLISRQHDLEFEAVNYIGFWIENQAFSLIAGFPMQNVITWDIASLRIDHLLTWEQFQNNPGAVQALLLKVEQLSLQHLAESTQAAIQFKTASIKKRIPLKFYTSFPLIARYFQRVLEQNGYERVSPANELSLSTDSFLLNLSDDVLENSTLGRSFPLDQRIRQLPGLMEYLDDVSLLPTPNLEELKTTNIPQARREQSFRLKKLIQRESTISSTKILDAQKLDTDQKAVRKIQLLHSLLENAEIWDNDQTILRRLHGENAFIFYDDQFQLPAIMEQLRQVARRFHFDVNKLQEIRNLFTLKDQILEPFLEEGVVVCCASAKVKLEEKLQFFQKELAKHRYQSLTKEERQLYRNKQDAQLQLSKLLSLDIFKTLHLAYRKDKKALEQFVTQAQQAIWKQQFSHSNIKEICLLSQTDASTYDLKRDLSQLFPGNNSVRISTIPIDLKLQTELTEDENKVIRDQASSSEEREELSRHQLTRFNLKQVAHFLSTIQTYLESRQADLLVWEFDLHLQYQLFLQLQRSRSRHRFTPILGIFTGEFDAEKYGQMTQEGVRLVYWDQFRKLNKDFLQEALLRAL